MTLKEHGAFGVQKCVQKIHSFFLVMHVTSGQVSMDAPSNTMSNSL